MVLEAYNLKKTYFKDRPLYKQILLPFVRGEEVKALDSVSICIESGELLGVVGPNGAGKTTLLKILADLLEPDEGKVSICGQMLSKKGRQIREMIGYVSSDERNFFWRLTGRENLEFFARLYGLSALQAKKRAAKLIGEFSFEKKADQLFRDYSAGMKKKVSVMRALMHEPCLLLMDEVTNSLDQCSSKIVKDMTRSYVSNKKDCAAIWSTHRCEEISEICDKVVTINSGKIISESFNVASIDNYADKYLLKLDKLNGQFEAFCQKIDCSTKVSFDKDNKNELVISGISQQKFSQIVSIAVKDFGVYVIFAGCIKKGSNKVFEEFRSERKFYGNC